MKKLIVFLMILLAPVFSRAATVELDQDTNGAVDISKGGTNAQTATANQVFAGPASGEAAAPGFRALVADDVPFSFTRSTTGNNISYGFSSVYTQPSGGGTAAVPVSLYGRAHVTGGTVSHLVGTMGHCDQSVTDVNDECYGIEGRVDNPFTSGSQVGVLGLTYLEADNAGTALNVGVFGQADVAASHNSGGTNVGGQFFGVGATSNFDLLVGRGTSVGENGFTMFKGYVDTGAAGVMVSISDVIDRLFWNLTDAKIDGWSIMFRDAAGAASFAIVDSGGVEVADIDSNGQIQSDVLAGTYAGGAAYVITNNAGEMSASDVVDPDDLDGDNTDDKLIDPGLLNITAANIEMDGSPSIDDTYKSLAINGTNAGEVIVQWDCVYFDNVAAEWMIADNTGEDTSVTPDRPKSCEAIATAAGSNGAELKVVTFGPIRNDAWNWTVGLPIYLSTAGDYTQTRPTSAAAFPQQIGFPLSADVMYFQPQPIDWGTTRAGTTAVDKVLTCMEATNSIWTVTVTAKDVTLPAVAECPTLGTTLVVVGAISTDLDVNASDRMMIDGTANADGHKATSLAAAGDQITCGYYDADGPVCQSNAWTQE